MASRLFFIVPAFSILLNFFLLCLDTYTRFTPDLLFLFTFALYVIFRALLILPAFLLLVFRGSDSMPNGILYPLLGLNILEIGYLLRYLSVTYLK
jgi:hypothetical protein